jgi:hypothetical protein
MPSSSSSSSSSENPENDRGIYLQHTGQTRYVAGAVQGYRLTVTAVRGSEMPNEIFRYIMRPTDPTTGATAGFLDGICSPADLEDLPINAPRPQDSPQFFRLATVDVVLRSQTEANEFWQDILDDVDMLINTLNLMDDQTPFQLVRLGNPP